MLSLGAAVYLGSSDTVGFPFMESSRLSSSTLPCMAICLFLSDLHT